ncbi:MAG: ectonucleotide pyrophosphatase/phosphodiesterase [Turicibacter sp.]|nr:ectonucleotide pyrophosphatase/phosphodiesterase [Turicibacter sp.]
MTKKLLVLSFDALGGEDFEYMKKKPAFKAFFDQAAICTNVSAIYPSVTYACHTSIVTGRLPKHHGIISNTLLQPNRVNAPDWYWQRKYVKGDTIYDAAIRSGMKVGAFLWPVTGKSRIQYNVPEIFPNRNWDNQIMTSLRNGSPLYLLELFKQYRHLLDGTKQPNLDDFVTQSVVHTLQTKAPDLTLVHFTDLDTARHDFGVRSEEAYAALDRLAARFERIMGTLKAEGLDQETTVVILGDHFQLDYHTKVSLNEPLAEAGWLTFNGAKVSDWDVLVKSNGGSAYVYAKDDSVDQVVLKAFLDELKEKAENGIQRILTGVEAEQLGADGDCLFMLEAREGYVFTDFLGGGEKGKKADHGYHPTWKSDYATFYAMAGPGVRAGARVEAMSLIDIAPTWAKMLGLALRYVDGEVVEEMIVND